MTDMTSTSTAAPPAYDLSRHPHFTEVVDDTSGIKRFVLSEHVMPLQKAWYFVTPSIGTGSQWLWFHAVTPPSNQWVCAAVSLDPNNPDIRVFPGTLVNGNPMLVDDGSAMLAPIEDGVYRIDVDGRCEEQFRIPKEFVKGRKLWRLVTELTRSCDGRHIIMDSQIGNRTVVWVWDTEQREARLLRSLDKKHMHTIASPTDPDLFIINQNPGFDPISGDKIDMDVRIWLMNISQTRFEPLQADLWWNHNAMPCQEWWTPDGNVQWCDYQDGIYECAAHGESRPRTLVWPRKLIHGQIDPTGRWMAGDYHPYKWNDKTPCSV